jgi:hypothetical protein
MNSLYKRSHMTKPLTLFHPRAYFLLLCWILNFGGQPTQPKSSDNGWAQLFNGKDLSVWKQVGDCSHYVEDGLIASHGGMGLLYWAKEKFSNSTIRMVFKMQKFNSNSGVFIRIPIEPSEAWMPVHYGYEVQIDNHPEASKKYKVVTQMGDQGSSCDGMHTMR